MSNIYSTQLLPTAATHKSSLTSFLDQLWNTASESLTSVASYSFPKLARSIVLKSLENLQFGELCIITPEKNVLTFGSSTTDPSSSGPALKAELRIIRPSFWTRILLSADLGFAEAYMYGDVDCDDIPTFLKLMVRNMQHIHFKSSSLMSNTRLLYAARFLGDLSTTRANVSAHYDIDNTMFAAFLSPDMNYSSAIFKDYEEDIRDKCPDKKSLETLEEGQIRKMRNLIYQARIRPNHRLLEIGTGWGSFAILAVQLTGCTIETITLSSEQKTLAEERIAAAGLSDKITVHLLDYREVKKRPEWRHCFDRFVSVEMMEHVGKEYFEAYWDVVDWALKEDDGVGVVQVITLPEARVEGYDREVDFIRKWVIFLGGYLPTLTHLIATMTSGTNGRLTTDSVWNIGPHYARTLREWKHNFSRNFESIIAPGLRQRYNLSDADLEIFRRKWCYYFEVCEVGFCTRKLGDHIITFTREGNVTLGCTWDDYNKIDSF